MDKSPAMKNLERGLEERERLRPRRVRNYRVKLRDGRRCRYKNCKSDEGLLVVKVGKGRDDDAYSTRCQRHLEGRDYEPGQWPDRKVLT